MNKKNSLVIILTFSCLVQFFVQDIALAQDEKDRDAQLIDKIKEEVKNSSMGHKKSTNLILENYDSVVRGVTEALRKNPKDEIHYQGQLHQLSRIAGTYRIKNAVGELAKGISLRIDSEEIPGGINVVPWYYYPFASALSEIGGKLVIEHMLKLIRSVKSTEEERELATWVLRKHYGKQIASGIIKDAINRAKNDSERNRLEQALKGLSEAGLSLFEKAEGWNKNKETSDRKEELTQEERKERKKRFKEKIKKRREKARKEHQKQVEEAIERVKERRGKKEEKNDN